jgi:phenylacetate-CoA ligase
VDLADTGKVEYVTTGGSTGVPVGFYQSVNLRGVERAFFRFQWKPYGVTPSDLSVVLRGAYVGSEAKPIRYFVRVHEWHLSIYQMTAARIPQYVRFINDVRPAFIQAYPSAVVPLAQYVLDNGLCMAGSLKAIMCGSENLYPNQKRLIENAFGVPVHSWYGQAEKVCLAVGEPGQEGLNVLPLYGLTELVSPTGGEASDRGASGEIVATSFWNDIVPFIRYKTGDIGIADDQDSASLYPTARRLERVEGRIHEYIVTGRGRVISMTAINMHDDIFDGIAYFRFYQDAPGHVELRVVPNAKFDRDLLSQIGTRIKAKLGDDCTVSVQCVDSLDRTSSGKFRFIEQHLSVDGYEKPGGDL